MKVRAVLCTIALFAGLAGADPFSGTWVLNLSKSKLPPPPPQRQTSSIEADSKGIRIRELIVNDKGEQMSITVDAKFDGKDYPIIGSPFVDTVAYQRVDSHTLKGIVKKAGQVVTTEKATVSPDGKTLTGTYSGTDLNGKQVTGVAVFEKQ
ncbi:MAG: hypothetical protein WCC22_10920 [Terriglobales bacterium]